MGFYLLDCRLLDQRTNLHAGFIARAHAQSTHLFGEFSGECIVNALLHINSIRTNTGLAGIAILRSNCAFHRCIKIGVVKHNKRGIAAQLKGEFFNRIGRLTQQNAAHFSRAGKAYLANPTVFTENFSNLGCSVGIANHHIENPRGNTRFQGKIGQRQCR